MSETNSDELISGDVNWNAFTENMLARLCDQAKCFEWMHSETYSLYNHRSRSLIVISNSVAAVSGISNVIGGTETIGSFKLAWVFGTIAICISVLNMLQDKLEYSKSAGEHRRLSTMWGSIRRKIEEELSIPRDSRKECGTFLKYIREDMNNVADGNVGIPPAIRKKCFDNFKNIANFDIPDICGQIEHTQIFMDPNQDNRRNSSHPAMTQHHIQRTVRQQSKVTQVPVLPVVSVNNEDDCSIINLHSDRLLLNEI